MDRNDEKLIEQPRSASCTRWETVNELISRAVTLEACLELLRIRRRLMRSTVKDS